MADDYLIAQAAQQQKLSVDEYVKKQAAPPTGVTEADAKKFYDKNKSPNAAPFEQIKPQLLEMMNRQAMLERLHKTEPGKIMLQPKRLAVDSSGHPSLGAKAEEKIKEEMAVGERVGVEGRPGFLIDGRPLVGAQPPAQFEQIIDDELSSGGEKQASVAH